MVSERKLAANRRNAKRSTGPKTPEGKAVVRYNALKHGLCAEVAVIRSGEGAEDPDEFRTLLEGLVEDFQPVGVSEHLLVERIAICHWRLGRAVRYETAEIRRSYGVPDASGDPTPDPASAIADLASGLMAGYRVLPGGAAASLERSSRGIDQLLKLVDDALFTVEALGHLSNSDRDRLLDAYGCEEGSVGRTCSASTRLITDRDEIAKDDPGRLTKLPGPDECKAILRFTLENERGRLRSLRRKVAKREAAQRELDQACLVLPPEPATDRLLRYENAIQRQLYRAMDQLDRLQRRRHDAAPPSSDDLEPSPN